MNNHIATASHSLISALNIAFCVHVSGWVFITQGAEVSDSILHQLYVRVICDEICTGGLWGITHNNPFNRAITASRLACVLLVKMTELSC